MTAAIHRDGSKCDIPFHPQYTLSKSARDFDGQTDGVIRHATVGIQLKMDQEHNKKLGKYLLRSRLGKGGMGVVYLATDSRLKRDVALKILPKSMSSNPVALKRFLREARVAASISHPNVVTVHDVDQINGQCFLVMELMTGGTAQDLLQPGPIEWREATRIISDTCRGLVAIHEAGLIHRDIKPSNIMLAANGVVKLTDFGLAKLTDSTANENRLTVPNTILGTPQFMSPEQCEGEELDCRSDLYSLGATYFALLTGKSPFPDLDHLQCMFAHCSKPVPDPRSIRPDISAASVGIVMKAMAKRRVERFESAHEMLSALENCLSSDQSASSRTSWLMPSNSAVDVRSAVDRTESTSFTISEPLPTNRETPRFDFVELPVTRLAIRLGSDQTFRKQFGKWMIGGLALLIGIAIWSFLGWNPTGKNGGKVSSEESSGEVIAFHDETSDSRNHNIRNQRVGPLDLKFEAEFPVNGAPITGVAFSPDARFLFSGSMNGEVRQWEVQTRRQVRQYDGVKQGIRAVATNQDWLVAGGEAKTVWLWNIDTAQPRAILRDFLGEISALAISPDGKRLAVGTYAEVRLFQLDAAEPQLIQVLGTSSGSTVTCYMVLSVSFSSDSQWIAATTWGDKAVAIWSAKHGELRDIKRNQANQPMAVAFVPREDRILFGTSDEGLFDWDVGRSTVRPILASQAINGQASKSIRTISITPDGGHVVTIGEWGGRIRCYSLHGNSNPVEFLKQTQTSSLGLDLSADGELLLMSGGEKDRGFIHLWRMTRESVE